jgi:crotonobetainyl-CoA:carnitine CoA-transferase CaiB-like acyl-CoA transferase
MRKRGHFPVGGPFPTSDGYVCMIGAFRPNPLQELCAVLGIEKGPTSCAAQRAASKRILTELGYTADQIHSLRSQLVIL